MNSRQHNDQSRFSSRPPLQRTKEIASKHRCDLAIPNGPGIGNVLVCTRLVEDYALGLGRPLRLFTAPLAPRLGADSTGQDYPIWANNPFVREIVNGAEVDREGIAIVNKEKDDLAQFNHIIENICCVYGLRPRTLCPSLFLTLEEMAFGLGKLSEFKRPIVAVHPFGKTSSPTTSRWYRDEWITLVDNWQGVMSFVQIGLPSIENKGIPIPYPALTLRQTMSVVWASDVFIGFDSSIAHLATAFQKPAFVLWDAPHKEAIEAKKEPGFAASMILRWGYPQNRNVALLGERGDEIQGLCGEFLAEETQLFNRKIRFNPPDRQR